MKVSNIYIYLFIPNTHLNTYLPGWRHIMPETEPDGRFRLETGYVCLGVAFVLHLCARRVCLLFLWHSVPWARPCFLNRSGTAHSQLPHSWHSPIPCALLPVSCCRLCLQWVCSTWGVTGPVCRLSCVGCYTLSFHPESWQQVSWSAWTIPQPPLTAVWAAVAGNSACGALWERKFTAHRRRNECAPAAFNLVVEHTLLR